MLIGFLFVLIWFDSKFFICFVFSLYIEFANGGVIQSFFSKDISFVAFWYGACLSDNVLIKLRKYFRALLGSFAFRTLFCLLSADLNAC